MTIRSTSYDTAFGSKLVLDKTIHAIKEAFIRDNLSEYNMGYIRDEFKCVFVTGQYSSESNIPYFFHPIVIEDKHKGEVYIVSDLRPFVKLPEYGEDGEIKPRNITEYNFHVNRAVFQMDWIYSRGTLLKASFPIAGAAFASWLSESITKKYSLDPKDRLYLNIIAHFYYQSLFTPESTFDEDTKQRFSVHTIKATKPPSTDIVFEVFDKIEKMDTAQDLCDNIRNILSNIRLKDFNLPVLYTITGNAWWNVSSAETLAIALEHPPTWLSIVLSSLTDRTFKNSLIARVALNIAKGTMLSELEHTCGEIMKANNTYNTESAIDFPVFE